MCFCFGSNSRELSWPARQNCSIPWVRWLAGFAVPFGSCLDVTWACGHVASLEAACLASCRGRRFCCVFTYPLCLPLSDAIFLSTLSIDRNLVSVYFCASNKCRGHQYPAENQLLRTTRFTATNLRSSRAFLEQLRCSTIGTRYCGCHISISRRRALGGSYSSPRIGQFISTCHRFTPESNLLNTYNF